MGAYMSYIDSDFREELQEWTFPEVVEVAYRIQRKHAHAPSQSSKTLKRCSGPAGVLFEAVVSRREFFEDFLGTALVNSTGKTRVISHWLFRALDGCRTNTVFVLDALLPLILCCYIDPNHVPQHTAFQNYTISTDAHQVAKLQFQRYILIFDLLVGNKIKTSLYKCGESEHSRGMDSTEEQPRTKIHKEHIIQGLLSLTTGLYLLQATSRMPGMDMSHGSSDAVLYCYGKGPQCIIPRSKQGRKLIRPKNTTRSLFWEHNANSTPQENESDAALGEHSAKENVKNAKAELQEVVKHMSKVTNAASSKGFLPKAHFVGYCLTESCAHQVLTRFNLQKTTFDAKFLVEQLPKFYPRLESKKRHSLKEGERQTGKSNSVVKSVSQRGSTFRVSRHGNVAGGAQALFKNHLRQKNLEKATNRNIIAEMIYKTNLDLSEVQKLKEKFLPLADSSGQLSHASFKMLMLSHFPSFGADDTCDKLFSLFDEDGNGTLDFREFVCGMARMISGDMDSKLEIMFDIFDLDGDGTISLHELIRFVKSSSQKIFDSFAAEQNALTEIKTEIAGQFNLKEFQDTFVERPVLAQAFGLRRLEEKYQPVYELVQSMKSTLAELMTPKVYERTEGTSPTTASGDRKRRGSILAVIEKGNQGEEVLNAEEFHNNFTFENVMEMYKAWSQQQRYVEDNPRAFEVYMRDTCYSGLPSRDNSPKTVEPGKNQSPNERKEPDDALHHFTKHMPAFLAPVMERLEGLPPTELDFNSFLAIFSVVFEAKEEFNPLMYKLWEECSACRTSFRTTMRESLRMLGLCLARGPYQKAEVLFRDFDASANGYVAVRNLNKLVVARQAELDENLASVTHLLSALDKDNSETISRNEFSEAIHQSPEILQTFGVLLGVSGNDENTGSIAMKQHALETLSNSGTSSFLTNDTVKEDLINRQNFVLAAHRHRFEQFSSGRKGYDADFVKSSPFAQSVGKGGIGPLKATFYNEQDNKVAQRYSRSMEKERGAIKHSHSDLRKTIDRAESKNIMSAVEKLNISSATSVDIASTEQKDGSTSPMQQRRSMLPRVHKKSKTNSFGGLRLLEAEEVDDVSDSSNESDTNPLVIWDQTDNIKSRKMKALRSFGDLRIYLDKRVQDTERELSEFNAQLREYEKRQWKLKQESWTREQERKREDNKLGDLVANLRLQQTTYESAKILKPAGSNRFCKMTRKNRPRMRDRETMQSRSVFTGSSDEDGKELTEKGNAFRKTYTRESRKMTGRDKLDSSSSSEASAKDSEDYPWVFKLHKDRGRLLSGGTTHDNSAASKTPLRRRAPRATDIHSLLNVRRLLGRKSPTPSHSKRTLDESTLFPLETEKQVLPVAFGSSNYGK